jgi:hypothetical protein
MLQISEEQLEEAIKNAKVCILFEDEEFQKQYFRGVKDTLENLLAKAKANEIINKF